MNKRAPRRLWNCHQIGEKMKRIYRGFEVKNTVRRSDLPIKGRLVYRGIKNETDRAQARENGEMRSGVYRGTRWVA